MPATKENSLKTLQPQSVGILAGNGPLPRHLAERLRTDGHSPFIVAFEGQTDPDTPLGFEHIWLRLGTTSRMFEALKKRRVKDLVLIGGMRRPSFSELIPDLKTLWLYVRGAVKARGDDELLRILRGFLEKEGFQIRGIDRFMPELRAPAGVLGQIVPTEQEHMDIKRGVEVLKATSSLDIGQAVIVQQGFVLGLAAAEGTDELIRRCESAKRKGSGSVLVKMSKAGQDPDLDRPVIGVKTIENAVRHGLSGIAVEAGKVLVAEMEQVLAIADKNKIFIIGIDVES